jgi:DNA polymerase III delta prime subunit
MEKLTIGIDDSINHVSLENLEQGTIIVGCGSSGKTTTMANIARTLLENNIGLVSLSSNKNTILQKRIIGKCKIKNIDCHLITMEKNSDFYSENMQYIYTAIENAYKTNSALSIRYHSHISKDNIASLYQLLQKFARNICEDMTQNKEQLAKKKPFGVLIDDHNKNLCDSTTYVHQLQPLLRLSGMFPFFSSNSNIFYDNNGEKIFNSFFNKIVLNIREKELIVEIEKVLLKNEAIENLGNYSYFSSQGEAGFGFIYKDGKAPKKLMVINDTSLSCNNISFRKYSFFLKMPFVNNENHIKRKLKHFLRTKKIIESDAFEYFSENEKRSALVDYKKEQGNFVAICGKYIGKKKAVASKHLFLHILSIYREFFHNYDRNLVYATIKAI